MGTTKKRKHSKSRGRPRKKRVVYYIDNTKKGRKRKTLSDPNLSEKTFKKRAVELANNCDNNVQLLELSLKSAKEVANVPLENDKILSNDDTLKHTK